MSDLELTTNEGGSLEVLDKKGVKLTGLALLPERTLLDEGQLAQELGVSPRTIRRMRERHEIPPSVRIAGRSMWFAGRVLAFIEEEAIRLEEEARADAKRLRRYRT